MLVVYKAAIQPLSTNNSTPLFVRRHVISSAALVHVPDMSMRLAVSKCRHRLISSLTPSPLSAALSSCSPSKSQHTSSTSEAVPPPTLSQNRSFSLPPGHAVCCFMDGGVGLYDMGAKKWDFLRDMVFRINERMKDLAS